MGARMQKKVALVTGPASGIGRGIAQAFSKEKAQSSAFHLPPESGPTWVGPPAVPRNMALSVPPKRMGTPEEIGAAVVWLGSAEYFRATKQSASPARGF